MGSCRESITPGTHCIQNRIPQFNCCEVGWERFHRHITYAFIEISFEYLLSSGLDLILIKP
jgi:hypothetical protein